MEKSVYYGYIVKGDLRGAISYVQQFPNQADLYNRYVARFDQEQYQAGSDALLGYCHSQR